MSSGKRRFAECKYDFIPHNLPEWKQNCSSWNRIPILLLNELSLRDVAYFGH